MTKVSDVIEQLKGTEYYLVVYQNGKRIGGGFVFTPETDLVNFLDYQVDDLEAKEGTDIIKVKVSKSVAKKKKEAKEDGANTREEDSKQDNGLPKKSRGTRVQSVSRKKASTRSSV